MSRPDTPTTALATEASLLWASSSTFCRRLLMRLRSSIICARWPGQVAQLALPPRGNKAPFQQPMVQQLRDPRAVLDIALAPGTFFKWRAFTSKIAKRSSRMLKIGFQYTPVDSMPRCVTPAVASQSAMAIRSRVMLAQ
jgi:hypothetical protein